MLKIMIADDHKSVRDNIKDLISDEFGKVKFGEAAGGNEALQEITSSEWDLIILDISMPGKNGLEVTKQVRKNNNLTPILMMSFNPKEYFASKAIMAGANGFIEKNHAVEELIKSIKVLINK